MDMRTIPPRTAAGTHRTVCLLTPNRGVTRFRLLHQQFKTLLPYKAEGLLECSFPEPEAL